MKYLFFLFLTFISNLIFSQDTLREDDSFMYSKYYILNSDGTFNFYFHHCTGYEYGEGTYQLTNKKIEFLFMPFKMPSDSIICSKDVTADSLDIKLYYFHDSTEATFYKILLDTLKTLYWSGYTELKLSSQIDTINISVPFSLALPIELHPQSDSCNVYRIYLKPYYSIYNSPSIVEMKKQKDGKFLCKYFYWESKNDYSNRKRKVEIKKFYSF